MSHGTSWFVGWLLLLAMLVGCGSQSHERVVEASCGQCQFEMQGSGCDLAVRIDGQSYFVEGANIDDFGDAHAPDGLCNCVRQAKVTGRVDDRGHFVATHFELLPMNQDP